jgi:TATA-box binding protein (TBP) (component of TFIID and TFIIIB)
MIRIKDIDVPLILRNIVVTYNLGPKAGSINLGKIALLRLLPLNYNPKKFAAGILPVLSNGGYRTTALIFENGNVVHTGATNEGDAMVAAHSLAWMFRRMLGVPADVTDFRVTNMVASFNMGQRINCFALRDLFGQCARFDPELIQSCSIHEPGTNVVALVYFTGGGVCTGNKTREGLIEQFRCLYAALRYTIDHGPALSISKEETRFYQKNRVARNQQLSKEFHERIQKLEFSNRMGKQNRVVSLDRIQSNMREYTRALDPLELPHKPLRPLLLLEQEEGQRAAALPAVTPLSIEN